MRFADRTGRRPATIDPEMNTIFVSWDPPLQTLAGGASRSPVRRTLAAVLLQQGRAEEAVDTFKQALDAMPRSGWALWGLMKAQAASGNQKGAAETAAAFTKAWLGDESLLQLDRL